MVTADRLRYLMDYNPENGVFTRLVDTGRGRAGDIAGTVGLDGHVQIQIDKKIYQAGRLAWLWMTGEWPKAMVDHKDTIRDNNKWLNLRLATRSQNQHNRGRNRNNTSGHKGVWRRNGKFIADIWINRKKIRIGSFDTAEEAASAYLVAAQKYHGDFARVS